MEVKLRNFRNSPGFRAYDMGETHRQRLIIVPTWKHGVPEKAGIPHDVRKPGYSDCRRIYRNKRFVPKSLNFLFNFLHKCYR